MKAKYIIFGIFALELLFLFGTRQVELDVFSQRMNYEDYWDVEDWVAEDETEIVDIVEAPAPILDEEEAVVEEDIEFAVEEEIVEESSCPEEFLLAIDKMELTGQERRFGEYKNFTVQNGYLNLSSKRLKEVPSSIYEESCITSLNLENNRLTAFPFGIQRLDQLSYLSLANNKINRIETFGNMRNLKHLDLSYNEITAIPYTIMYMRSLEHLDLSGNYDLEILTVENLKKLANLKVLNIRHTKIKRDKRLLKELLNELPNVKIRY